MFRELMNFSYRRTPLQAFGWYLTFFLIGVVLSGIAGAIFGRGKDFATQLSSGMHAGAAFILLYSVILTALIMWTREKNVGNVLIALAGVLISSVLGALGGLIPLAILTTRR
jgi:hypothetical protein